MKKIDSFTIDHSDMTTGLYLSRIDSVRGVNLYTYDVRVTEPNREPAMDSAAMHTIEHLMATYLRNSSLADRVIYFGPMGCKTGFYLIVEGGEPVIEELLKGFKFMADFKGELPGSTAIECGNYTLHNLDMAKYYADMYLYRSILPEFGRKYK